MITKYKNSANKAGTYKITNIVNNKIYVGATTLYKRRFKQHVDSLSKNKHSNCHLQNSYNKYGKDAFVFEVLEVVNENVKEKLQEKEQVLLDLYWDGCINCYNIKKAAKYNYSRSMPKGRKLTKEHKQNISKSQMGKSLSQEHKNKISENAKNNPNYGMRNKRCSDLHKKRISKSRLGKKHWFYGKKKPEETIAKMRNTYKCVLLSPDGTLHFGFIGLKRFAKTHNLSPAGLRFLITDERKSHKGWIKLKKNFLVRDKNHPSKWRIPKKK